MKNITSLPVIVDVGMFDAADTLYYLETGHRVVAIEALASYVARAKNSLKRYLTTGQLTILNVAIAVKKGPVSFTLNTDNAGGGSIIPDMVGANATDGTVTVDGCTMEEVLSHVSGRIKLIKIDIEGADSLALSALTSQNRPEFLCCEMHEGLRVHLARLQGIGFEKFKLIDQTTFLSVSRGRPLMEKLAHAFLRRANYAEPRIVRRANRWFNIGFSSGPAPWESDGTWFSAAEIGAQFDQFIATNRRNVWLDLHAC